MLPRVHIAELSRSSESLLATWVEILQHMGSAIQPCFQGVTLVPGRCWQSQFVCLCRQVTWARFAAMCRACPTCYRGRNGPRSSAPHKNLSGTHLTTDWQHRDLRPESVCEATPENAASGAHRSLLDTRTLITPLAWCWPGQYQMSRPVCTDAARPRLDAYGSWARPCAHLL